MIIKRLVAVCLALSSECLAHNSEHISQWVPKSAIRFADQYNNPDDRAEHSTMLGQAQQISFAIVSGHRYFLEGELLLAKSSLESIDVAELSLQSKDLRSSYFLQLGQTEYYLGNPFIACEYFALSYDLARLSANPYIYLEASSQQASCLMESSNDKEALAILSDAMNVASSLTDEDELTQGRLLRLLARSQVNQGLFDEAASTLQQSITSFSQANSQQEIFYTLICWSELARLYAVPTLFEGLQKALATELKQKSNSLGDVYALFFEALSHIPPFIGDLSVARSLLLQTLLLLPQYETPELEVNARAYLMLIDFIQGRKQNRNFSVYIQANSSLLNQDIGALVLSLSLEPSEAKDSLVQSIISEQTKLQQLALAIKGHHNGVIVPQMSEAYQAEISRQHVEIARLNNVAMAAENLSMKTKQNVSVVIVIFLVLGLAYAVFSRGRFKQMAVTDSLTRLPNRRFVYHYLSKIVKDASSVKRTSNKNRGIGVMLIDVDFFKRVNDTRGHDAGDHALRQLAKIASESVSNLGRVARFGGEEFCVILPKTTPYITNRLAEKLRKNVECADLGLKDLRLTVSIGIKFIEFNQLQTSINADTIISSADFSLYQAKANGRNQVVGNIGCHEGTLIKA